MAIRATSVHGAVLKDGKDRCDHAARMRCEIESTHHVLAVATSLAGVCGLYGFRDPLPTPIATNFGYYNTAIELYPTVQGSAAGRAKIHVML